MKKFLFVLMAAASLSASQSVVFDFGGVMTGDPQPQIVIGFLCQSFHLTPTQFETLNNEKRIAVRFGKTDTAFWLEYAAKNDISLDSDWQENFQAALKKGIAVNSEMYALVAELREKQIPVAMLSNIDERYAKLFRSLGLYEPFVPCLLSCEIDAEKPDSKAYETLLQSLNLPSNEVIFIDDRLENVEEARKMGLDAILFESPAQIRAELQSRDLL